MGTWRGSIDFVSENDVGKEWTFLELESRGVFVKNRDSQNISREEIGCELDAGEGAIDGSCDRCREHRLADTGDVLDECVPSREQTDQEALHSFGIPEIDSGNVVTECLNGVLHVEGSIGQTGDTNRNPRSCKLYDGDGSERCTLLV